MTSIDGLLDHFDVKPALHLRWRASLQLQQPRHRESTVPGNILLWLLVAILHVGLFGALQIATRPLPVEQHAIAAPLQITIVRLPESRLPTPTAAAAILHPTTSVDFHRVPHLQRAVPRTEGALQAISLPPSAGATTLQALDKSDRWDAPVLHDVQGRAGTERNPFARRAATDMLPGSDRVVAPGIRMRVEMTPQKVVERIGALFGGGHVDPCPEYEERLLNTDNETERDEQMDRYARACPGR